MKTKSRSCRRMFSAIFVGLFLATGSSALSATVKKPEPAKSDTATADPAIPPTKKMALKLAGLVTFVASSCPGLQPNYDRFKGVIGTFGVSTADLERSELKNEYLGYALRYKAESVANCARALKDFGPGGAIIADVVKPRSK